VLQPRAGGDALRLSFEWLRNADPALFDPTGRRIKVRPFFILSHFRSPQLVSPTPVPPSDVDTTPTRLYVTWKGGATSSYTWEYLARHHAVTKPAPPYATR